MNEKIVDMITALLNNFWILKEDNSEMYYAIRRYQNEIRAFTSKDLGSKLIIRDRFVKLEKIPTIAGSNLGISSFRESQDYTFLCLILLYLEDKTKGTFFILSNLIDYVKSSAVALELDNVPDWTKGKDRKSLKRAMDFLIEIGAVRLKDQDRISFNESAEAEALYEATGLSNYVMRMFNNSIFDYEKEEDFIKDEWLNQDDVKGEVRKYKVYRNLVYTPCVLTRDLSESEWDYIKKLRGHMSEELMGYCNLELEVSKSMSFVYEYESNVNKEAFPNNKSITGLVLLVNARLLEMIESGGISLDEHEIGYISKETLFEIIKSVRESYSQYMSSYLKNLSYSNLYDEVLEYMEKYSFLKRRGNVIEVNPTVGRFIGSANKKEELALFGSDVDV